MNINLLKSKLVLKELTIESLANLLTKRGFNIHKSTLYRKFNGMSEFQRDEIQAISKILDLTQKEIVEIFFTEHLS